MELWIPITIAAAFSQNLRSMLQKHLKGRLSTGGATYARFIYAWPFAIIYLLVLANQPEFTLPSMSWTFALYMMFGGATQIAATTLLIYLFSFRNFAVGTTFSKTETVQAAIFGAVFLADPLSLSAVLAILISLAGIVALSAAHSGVGLSRIIFAWTERTSLIGLASGACFGASAVSYRAASLSLGGDGFLIQASYTLAWVLGFQTLVMGAYLLLRERGEIANVLRNWKTGAWVGVTGMLASACWFTAMTIQNAAYVRALGQVELVFTFIAAHLFFREKTAPMEFAGILLVIAGILVLLLG